MYIDSTSLKTYIVLRLTKLVYICVSVCVSGCRCVCVCGEYMHFDRIYKIIM